MTRIKNYKITNEISTAAHGAIEIELELENGQRRWAFFFTPEGIATCGDLIPETNVRIHFGISHMIIVSEISEDIINRTLKLIESEGLIESNTMVIE